MTGYFTESGAPRRCQTFQRRRDVGSAARRDRVSRWPSPSEKDVVGSPLRVDMAHPRYSSNEIAERGQALYEREIQSSLAASDRGKFLVLDIETGQYEFDADGLAAVKRARAKRPDGAFYVLRVGQSAAYRLGLKSLTSQAC
jgi:hypothetical protein